MDEKNPASSIPMPQTSSSGQPWSVSYVDFTPTMLTPPGMMKNPTYERFDVLVVKANEYLRQNPQCRVKIVESLESMTPRHGNVDTLSSKYYESDDFSNFFNRSLRLWIVPKAPTDPDTPQQLGYYNVVPACLSPPEFFKSPKFESFDITIDKVNQLFRQNPIQGKIINLETQDVKFEEYNGSLDPDECFWVERKYTSFLNIIRIFFEAGPPAMEDIGVADFVPAMVAPKQGMFDSNKYEALSAVTSRANDWMTQQTDIRFTNVQSMEYKVSQSWGEGERVDTMRSLYHDPTVGANRYMRILRVYYTRSFGPEPVKPEPLPVISQRTFLPPQVTSGSAFITPDYENQVDNMKRVQAWCNAVGAKVISCETVQTRLGRNWIPQDPEKTYFLKYSGEFIVIVLRIYMEGVYEEPPPEVLPPLPEVADTSCCPCCTIL